MPLTVDEWVAFINDTTVWWMMSPGKSKRSEPRAKLMSEALREQMGEKRYKEWLERTEPWLKDSPDELLRALTSSPAGLTK